MHELAHGWVAWLLGDPTAKQHGRLSLNPLRHLDTWGTAMLFLTFLGSNGSFFFGWAKPVPIGPWHFKHPQRGMMLVGAAGPRRQPRMALRRRSAWPGCSYPSAPALRSLEAINLTFALNIILAVFNLIPIPPLDGSRIVGGLLPAAAYTRDGRSSTATATTRCSWSSSWWSPCPAPSTRPSAPCCDAASGLLPWG